MNMSSSFIATCSSAASSPVASQSPGMPIASGKPDGRMSVEPRSFDAASTSQVRLKDAYLGPLMEEAAGETRRIKKKKKIQKTPTILQLKPGTIELVAPIVKLGRTPLHTEPVLQLTRKVKRIRKRRGTTISTYRRTHRTMWKPCSPWSENLWKTTWPSYERFECDFGHLGRAHEYHSSSSSSSGKRLWHEFTLREEPYLGLSGTVIWWNRKTGLWKVRNPWSKNTREIVGLKIIELEETTWRSISLLCEGTYQITTAKSLRLLRLSTFYVRDERWPKCSLDE